MAEVTTIEVKVNSDQAARAIRQLQGDMKKFDARIKASQKNVKSFGESTRTSMSGIKSAIVGAAGALGAFEAGRFLVGTIAEFEKLQTTLRTFSSSAEEAEQRFNLIKDTAKTLPFNIDEVLKSFNILARDGIAPTKEELQDFSDIAAGNAKSLEQFAEAVVDAQVGEFERLKEFGIRASKQGEEVQLTFGNVTKTVVNSSEEIQRALQEIAKENFAGAAAAQAKTLGGAVSILGDQFKILAFEIGEGGLKQAIADVIERFSNFSRVSGDVAQRIGQQLGDAVRAAGDAFFFMIENIDKVGIALAGLAVAKTIQFFGNLVTSIGAATTAMRAFSAVLLANPIGLIATAVGAVVSGLLLWYQNTLKAQGVTASFFEIIKAVGEVLWNRISPAVEFVIKKFKEWGSILGDLGSVLKEWFNNLIASLVTVKDTVSIVATTFVEAFRNAFTYIGELASSFGRGLLDAMNPFSDGPGLTEFFSKLEQGFSSGFAELAPKIKAQADANFNQDYFSGLSTAAKEAFAGVTDEVTKTIQKNQELNNSVATTTQTMTTTATATQTAAMQVQNLGTAAAQTKEQLDKMNDQKKFNGTFQQYIENIKAETDILRLNRKEREIATEVLRAENRAKAAGAELTKEQREELERVLEAKQRAEEGARRRDEAERKSRQTVIDKEKEYQQVLSQTGGYYQQSASQAVSAGNTINDVISQLLGRVLGNRFGSTGSSLGGLLGNIFTKFINRGSTTSSSRPAPTGNIFTSSGVTPIVPTASLSSGSPVSTGGGVNVTNNITINGTNLSTEELARAINVAVKEGIASELRRRV